MGDGDVGGAFDGNYRPIRFSRLSYKFSKTFSHSFAHTQMPCNRGIIMTI